MSSTKTCVACPSDDFHERWCLGVPYKECREMTLEERGFIRHRFIGFTITVALCLILCVFTPMGTWKAASEPFEVLAYLLLPVVLYGWIPLARTLLNGSVDIYAGEALTPWTYDSSRDAYHVEANQNNRIEVIGNCILWTINGSFPERNLSILKRIASIFPMLVRIHRVARSQPEKSRLTSSERAELGQRILRYLLLIIGQLLLIAFGLTYLSIAYVEHRNGVRMAFDTIAGNITFAFIVLSLSYSVLTYIWRTALLTIDLIDPKLDYTEFIHAYRLHHSRAYWIVDHQPASWRISSYFRWKPPVNRLPFS